MTEPISELDLMAYVDDQIGPGRRIEVEEYLARHPAMAARVMDDLRLRDELRLALTRVVTEIQAQPTTSLVRRLEWRLTMRLVVRRLRPAAAACMLLAGGWLAHAAVS